MATCMNLGPIQCVTACGAMLCFWFGQFVVATADAQDTIAPDVVLINCDDLGWGDLSCYGSTTIATPNIDRMAEEGLRLTSFYVAQPICTASRAALMTGCYAQRLGLHNGVLRPGSVRGLAAGEVTVAEMLRQAGYSTAMIGKWHLGFVDPFRPTDQGFDSYVGVYHNLDAWETVYFDDRRVPWMEQTKATEPVDNTAITELYGQAAIDRLRAGDDRPLFLYLAHAFPHIPLGVGKAFVGRSAGGLYGDSIEQIDHETGRILEAVTARMQRTGRPAVVIFTSDNGPSPISSGSAGIFRGTKHTSWEGGLRVPCVIWGPSLIPSGATSGAFVSALDLMPSLAKLCGGRLPDDRVIDGVSAQDVFFRGAGKSPRNEMLFHNGGGRLEGLRVGDWKVRWTGRSKPQLFNLSDDPGESTDLAAEHPERTRSMADRAKALSKRLLSEARDVGRIADATSPKRLPPVYDFVISDLSPESIERAESAARTGVNVAAYVQKPAEAIDETRRRLARHGIPLRPAIKKP